MKTVALRNSSLVALVDDDDYELVSQLRWRAHKGYAVSKVNGSLCHMHRLIMQPPKESEIDHRDGVGLNNQRNNLRICTRSQNCCNRPKYPAQNTTSRFKGVAWNRTGKRWLASIQYARRYRYLGLFDTEEQAALAYDNAARFIHGEFAYLNFPGRNETPQIRRLPRGPKPASGSKGIRKYRNRWVATICIPGRRVHLGTFSSQALAVQAYQAARGAWRW